MTKLSSALTALVAVTMLLGAAHVAPVHAAPQCADPSGYCPTGDLAPGAQNPQVGNTSVSVQVAVSSDVASAGDTVLFIGEGFAALGRGGEIFVNLVYPDGTVLDTRSAAITCPTLADGTPVYFVDSWGEIATVCSSGTAGQVITSDAAGNFIGAVRIPDIAPAGPAELCASSVFVNPVCAAITID